MSSYLLDPWPLIQSEVGRGNEEPGGTRSCMSLCMAKVIVGRAGGSGKFAHLSSGVLGRFGSILFSLPFDYSTDIH